MLSSIGNFYESLVMECIHETLTRDSIATDADYVEDIACIALNYLPPRYVRHVIDLSSHLTDEEHRTMREEVQDAVGFAINMMHRRHQSRTTPDV